MSEKTEKSVQAENIFTRLVKAQAEFVNIRKENKATAFGNGRGYSYATISDVLEVVRPILNANGLSVLQRTATESDRVGVETVIFSAEGERLESGFFFVPTAGLTQKGAQAYGGALSYARRYSLTSFLGIAYGDEDDDGVKASEGYYAKKTAPAANTAPAHTQNQAATPAPQTNFSATEATAVTYFGAPYDDYVKFFQELSTAEKAHIKDCGLHEKIKASLIKN